MQKIFNQILIPCCSRQLPEEGIKKAIGFANQLDCHLHLLYVKKENFLEKKIDQFLHGITKSSIVKSNSHISGVKSKFESLMKPGLKLFVSASTGLIENAILQYIDSRNIDLVLLCRDERVGWWTNSINPDTLSANTECPVFCTRFLPDLQEMKIIVLPVDNALPVNKIRIAMYLARQFEAVIHLLAVESKPAVPGQIDYLKRAWLVLKENTDQPFICHTIQENNPGEGALDYARTVQASLVLVKPKIKKKFLTGFVLQEKSIPVLAVS